MADDDVLGPRALNRALLARQLLLERADDVPVGAAVERLVGLQAQAPLPPYLALWSRLQDFDPHELGRMLTDRAVVRLTLMRGTVHLVTVPDALLLRPLVQVVVARQHAGVYGKRMGGADPEQIAAVVRELLAERPLGGRALADELLARGIGDDREALTNATRVHVPLVQLPPRGVWGEGGRPVYATLEAWTGREVDPDPSIDAVVLRYLAAFGPATVMDMQNWSGLTKLRPAFERLRPRLVTFRDERGKELFDLPGAPRPGPDVPAPVRFLGEFDNVLLGHADRARIVPPDFPLREAREGGRAVGHLLVDGMLRGTWWLEDGTLAVRALPELSAAERRAVLAEGEGTAAFAGGDGVRVL